MSIICQNPETYLPSFAVSELPQAAVSSQSDSTILGNLLFETRVFEAGYSNYQIEVSPATIGDTFTFSNETPAVCSVSSTGLVTRISDGLGKVLINSVSGGKQRVSFTFANGNSTTFVWKGYTGTSVSSVLASRIKTMLQSGGDKEYYLPYTQGATTATLNPDRWFTPDISASALATRVFGGWSTANTGCLIAPRVFVGVQHWDINAPSNLTPGCKILFRSAAGVYYERTVLSRFRPGLLDLYVCILDDVAMPGISPMRIAGNWFLDEITANSVYRGKGAGFAVHQNKKIRPIIFDPVLNLGEYPLTRVFSGAGVTGVAWNNIASVNQDPESYFYNERSYFGGLAYGTAEVGDSGGLIGIVDATGPICVSLFSGPDGGYLFYEGNASALNSYIQSAAALAGVTITDTVTVAASPI